MFQSGKLWLLSLPVICGFMMMTGCSASHELSGNDAKLHLMKKGVNDYKNSTELVATNTFASKTSISKVNLESISSSLAGLIKTESENSALKDAVMYKIIEYINTPYLWGGQSKHGIDCSAFVQSIMYQAIGISLPRTSYEQSNVGNDVAKGELQFGDLLFFDTMSKGRVSHVGIYLGDGYFAHSGSRTGVAIASLDSDYYSTVFLKAKRVLKNDKE
ncbi:NlpC/P60 family protein [bacterium]|nr:MAG: NlpC/P60 family protein [bacterium]